MGSGQLRKCVALFARVLLSFFILTIGLAFGAGKVFAVFGDPTITDDVDRWTDATYTSTHVIPVFADDDDADGTPGISEVNFRLDGGAWTPCVAEDGAFDSANEAVLCTLTGLSAGSHDVEIYATDLDANDSAIFGPFSITRYAAVNDLVFSVGLDDSTDIYEAYGYGPTGIQVGGAGDITDDLTGINGGIAFLNDARVEFPDINSRYDFDGPTGQFRAEAYVKRTDFDQGVYNVVLGKVNTAGDDYSWFMGVDAGGGVICTVNTNAWHFTESSFDGTPDFLTNDAWSKISCDYDASTGLLEASIDDVVVSSITLDSGQREIPASTGVIVTNGDSTIDASFNGSIDEVKIFNVAALDTGAPLVDQVGYYDIATKSLSSTYVAHLQATAEVGRTIASAQYQIAAEGWNSCAATDGAFDEQIEGLTCSVTGLTADVEKTISFRATDSTAIDTLPGDYLTMLMTYVTSPAGNLIAHFPFDNAAGGTPSTLEDVVGFVSLPEPIFNTASDIGNDTTSGHNGASFASGARIHYADSNEVLSFGGPNARFKTEAYVKAADFGAVGYARVLSKTKTGVSDESWVMGVDNTGGIYCAIFTDSQYLIETGHLGAPGQLTNAAWNKIACSYDSTNGALKAYLNDVVIATTTVGSSGREIADSANYFSVNSVDGGSPLNGSVDELKVYQYSSPITVAPAVSLNNDLRYRTTNGDYELRGIATSGENITNVQFRGHNLEIGPDDFWSECTADDASFNSTSEAFTCTTPTLVDGRASFQVRAKDSALENSPVIVTNAFLDGGEQIAYWWDFENIVDAGYHPGTNNALGGVTVSGSPTVEHATYEEAALAFTGTEQFAYSDPSATLAASTSGILSMKFRIKPDTAGLGNYRNVLQKMVGAGDTSWDVLINPDGNVVTRMFIPGGDALVAGESDARTLLDMDVWNDVEIVWDFNSRILRMHVNDSTVVNSPWLRPEFPQSAPGVLYLGNSENIDAGFIGLIDDLIIYKDSDATPPTITIDSISNSDRVTDTTPTFTAQIHDDTGIVSAEYLVLPRNTVVGSYILDDYGWIALTPDDLAWDEADESVTVTLSDLADLQHDIFFRAVDTYGNKSLYPMSAQAVEDYFKHYAVTSAYVMPFYHFVMETHDTTAPRIYANAVVPDPTIDRMPAVRGYVKDYLVLNEGDTISNISSILYSIDGGEFIEIAPLDGSYDTSREDFYVQIPSALLNGAHTVTIRAVDSATNTTASGTVNEALGDVTISFTVTSSGIQTDPQDVVRDIVFSSHDFRDEIFSDAVWGNDMVRLHQKIDFTSAPDYTPVGNDEYGWTYGEVNITSYPAAGGNIWVATNNGGLVYYNTTTQTATSYPTLKSIGQQASVKEFEHGGHTYLFIALNNGGTSIIYDINDTPEDVNDDPAFADLADNAGLSAVNRIGSAEEIDTRNGELAIYGAATTGIVRLNLNNTPMDVSDDTYTLWGEAMGVGVNESDVYNGGFTALYFDPVENLFVTDSFGLGLFICSDAGTPTNQGDDACSSKLNVPRTSRVFSIIKDPNGWYWEGSDYGVMRFHMNGTLDIADDTFEKLVDNRDIGGEAVAQLWWVAGEYPVGDEIWYVTRSGRLRGVEYNSTYDDNTDDTSYTYKIPGFEYQQGGGMSFVVTDKNTMWTPVAGRGLEKITLVRDYDDTNVVEIFPTPPAGLLDVDHVLLSSVVGSVSAGSMSTLDELTTFEVSNDAGVTWTPIEIGSTIDFTDSDYKLKLRITLHKGSTPILSSLSLSYIALPGDVIADPEAPAGGGSTTSSGSSTSGIGGSNVCTTQQPGAKAPYVYAAVPLDDTSILLYFTEADGPLDRYILQYGTRSGVAEYGAQYIGGAGTRTYKVGGLTPNKTYYFSLRAGNGCAVGAWSNETSSSTRRYIGGTLIENVVTKVQANMTDDVTTGVPTWSPENVTKETAQRMGATAAKKTSDRLLQNIWDNVLELPWLWIAAGLTIAVMVLWLLGIAKRRRKKAQLPFADTVLPAVPQYFTTH